MQIALTQKGSVAFWVANGCTSMSKLITTKSTPMGVDTKTIVFSVTFINQNQIKQMLCIKYSTRLHVSYVL